MAEQTPVSDEYYFLYGIEDNIATITLNRPEKFNAFTRSMGADFITLIDKVDADDEVRALVITGAGAMFCAGADLSAKDSSFAKNRPDNNTHTLPYDERATDWSDESIRDFGGVMTLRMYECTKPIIVAFNGTAAGMGVTMALAADIRVASKSAKFTLPFVARGIVPESASSWFLTQIVGLPTALEWTLTGRKFLANEALDRGLVRSTHEPDEVLPVAYTLAREITANAAPVSVALTRQLMWRMATAKHPMEAHKIESRCIYSRSKSGDIIEGVDSFKQRRPAQFTDKVTEKMPSFYPWWEPQSYE